MRRKNKIIILQRLFIFSHFRSYNIFIFINIHEQSEYYKTFRDCILNFILEQHLQEILLLAIEQYSNIEIKFLLKYEDNIVSTLY